MTLMALINSVIIEELLLNSFESKSFFIQSEIISYLMLYTPSNFSSDLPQWTRCDVLKGDTKFSTKKVCYNFNDLYLVLNCFGVWFLTF